MDAFNSEFKRVPYVVIAHAISVFVKKARLTPRGAWARLGLPWLFQSVWMLL